MKILFFWPYGIPQERNRGIFQRVKSLGETYDVTLYTRLNFVAPEIVQVVSIQKMPKLVATGNSRILYWFWCIVSVLRSRTKPEIVYTVHQFDTLLGFVLSRMLKCKWVVDGFHSPYHNYDFAVARRSLLDYLRSSLYLLLSKWLLRFADYAVVMAHSNDVGFARLLINEFNVKQDRILAVPDGVDLSITKPSGAKQKECRKTIRLVHIGGVSVNKGYELLEVMKILSDNTNTHRFELCLAGPISNDIRKPFIKFISNQEKFLIRYYGRISHKEALSLMQSADICICSLDGKAIRDYQYAHPVKVFEYLALEKAVVAPDLEGIKGIVQDRINGLLYEAGNVHHLAEVILQLCNDYVLRNQLEANARRSVESFDWQILNKRVCDGLRGMQEGSLRT